MRIEYFGLPGQAKGFEEMLRMTASMLGVSKSLRITESKSSEIVANTSRLDQDIESVNRLKTMDRITGGYFHDFVECLSVILGQIQIMQYELESEGRAVTPEHLLFSAERINKAAQSLAEGINKVRDVSIFSSTETGRFIGADKFLRALPALTYGYSSTVKESKNLELMIQSKTDGYISLPMPVLHIYDYVLPLILLLMDEAICSGKIVVSLAEYFGRPALRISFSKNIIGKLELEKLTQKLFVKFDTVYNENGSIELSFGDAEFVFKEEKSGQSQIIYTLASKAMPIEESS
jgi:hypothetical protein